MSGLTDTLLQQMERHTLRMSITSVLAETERLFGTVVYITDNDYLRSKLQILPGGYYSSARNLDVLRIRLAPLPLPRPFSASVSVLGTRTNSMVVKAIKIMPAATRNTVGAYQLTVAEKTEKKRMGATRLAPTAWRTAIPPNKRPASRLCSKKLSASELAAGAPGLPNVESIDAIMNSAGLAWMFEPIVVKAHISTKRQHRTT